MGALNYQPGGENEQDQGFRVVDFGLSPSKQNQMDPEALNSIVKYPWSELGQKAMSAGPNWRRTVGVLLMLGILFGGAYMALSWYVEENFPGADPFALVYEKIMALMGQNPQGLEQAGAPAVGSKAATSQGDAWDQQPANGNAVTDPELLADLANNPYLSLPNAITVKVERSKIYWTPQEEEDWRTNLNHQYPYQRFKTIHEVRELGLAGSEAILWEGLADAKFWTRMEALFGLAQFGLEVPIDSVAKVVRGTRLSPVQNYFKRFEDRSSATDRYILRQALKVVHPEARAVILTSLATGDEDEFRRLYLVAATMDASPKVKDWYDRAQPASRYPTEELSQAQASVEGYWNDAKRLNRVAEQTPQYQEEFLPIEEIPTESRAPGADFLNDLLKDLKYY